MRVLVVEDNALLRHHLKVQIQDAGHQVDDAEDAKEADYYLNEHYTGYCDCRSRIARRGRSVTDSPLA
ncbi:two-component response regulator [Escherichia coli]|uniref:Two-component response regulator n=1 Tax=Escherichia coli TaxID=562 RepID=A0A2X1KV25_ECOLX|nr:two-component response regulator [Escherichia coli]